MPSAFRSRLVALGLGVLLQALAATYFITDAVRDEYEPGGGTPEALLELVVAIALVSGVVLGTLAIAALVREMRRRAAVVAMARGAMAEILSARFADWRLSPAEADVALFALKGCTTAEIAALRGAAPATVRVQLSQVYAKAGVSSQPMLMSLFLDELMAGEPLAA